MQHKDKKVYKTPVLPSRELLLWEKWVQIRREETTGLGQKLNRPPVDLAMNLLAKTRKDKERKVALEHAQIEKKTKLRGGLWEQPPRLKQHCYCAPVYELHRTPAELGEPPIIQHIGVPAYIKQTELGMAGDKQRKPCPLLNADYEYYRENRELDLHEKIKQIDPFRPDIKNLIVKGNNPPPPPPKMPPIPEITIHDADNFPQEPLSGVYALKINDTVLYKDIPDQTLVHMPNYQKEHGHEFCTKWTYYLNVPVKRAGRCKLYLQNLGTVSVRYCWKKIKRMVPFIPEDTTFEQVFFFNKNEDVIPPGQCREICFTFMSDKPGIYSEIWELSTSNICFFDNMSDKLIVNLCADSVEDIDMLKRKVEVLKTRINRKSVNNIACEFIEEILDRVFEVIPQIYPYKKYFLEAELFVLKNPVCFYHQTEVEKMKNLYQEMVPRKNWDLSINTWRHVMMDKEYEDRMKYYDLLKTSHAELLKPWYEGDGLAKEKYRTVYGLLGQLAEMFEKEFARISESVAYNKPQTTKRLSQIISKSKTLETHYVSVMTFDSRSAQMIRNIFYLRMYEHFTTTIELCAGVLSSLDLNRWIEFDFCRHYD